MIDGVALKELEVISDERGKVMHMLRRDDDLFADFGEIYFSYVKPGIIKGWKKHHKMTQNFAVPVGNIKLVLFDDRGESVTSREINEIMTGSDEYRIVSIPPGICYSFMAVGGGPALIANCTDIPHDPEEVENTPLGSPDIPYDWNSVNKG